MDSEATGDLIVLIVAHYTELQRLKDGFLCLPEKKTVLGERGGFLKALLLSGFRWRLEENELEFTNVIKLRLNQVGTVLGETLQYMVGGILELRKRFPDKKSGQTQIEYNEALSEQTIDWFHQLIKQFNETQQIVAFALFLLLRKGVTNFRKAGLPDELIDRAYENHSDLLERMSQSLLMVMEDPFTVRHQQADLCLDLLNECPDRATKVIVLCEFMNLGDGASGKPKDEALVEYFVNCLRPQAETEKGIIPDRPFGSTSQTTDVPEKEEE